MLTETAQNRRRYNPTPELLQKQGWRKRHSFLGKRLLHGKIETAAVRHDIQRTVAVITAIAKDGAKPDQTVRRTGIKCVKSLCGSTAAGTGRRCGCPGQRNGMRCGGGHMYQVPFFVFGMVSSLIIL
jgi:hypothetical protein